MDIIYIYITAPSMSLAETLSLSLVKERFAACVNIIPGMKSIYRWQGTVEAVEEAVMIVKTTRERFDDIVAHVRANHPYDTPCITALPVVDSSSAYMKWIEACSTPSKLA